MPRLLVREAISGCFRLAGGLGLEKTLGPVIARLLIGLIRIYQVAISPLLGPVCRFYPSCSRYAAECLRLHGAARGSWLAVRRLMKCHPFHPGGHDPPPLPKGATSAADGS